MDKHLSDSEKQKEIDLFRQEQQRQYNRGLWIVLIIAAVNVLGALISLILSTGSILHLLVQIAFSVALWRGVVWIRYLFAIGSAGGCLMLLYLVSQSDFIEPAGFFLIGLYLAFMIASAIVLFVNKSVSEFLYTQKNG